MDKTAQVIPLLEASGNEPAAVYSIYEYKGQTHGGGSSQRVTLEKH